MFVKFSESFLHRLISQVCPGRVSKTFLRVIFHIRSGTLWEGEVVGKRENQISVLLGLHEHVEFDQGYLQQGR